jgi:hypothetical protein
MIGIIISLILVAYAVRLAVPADRPITIMISISASYYTFGAYFYWIGYAQGVFVLRQWPIEDLLLAAQLIAFTAALLALTIASIGRLQSAVMQTPPLMSAQFARSRLPFVFWFMLSVSLLCSGVVLREGSFGNGAWNRSSFFLIAYQFSDVLIPVLCYRVARRGLDRLTVALLLYFTVYTVLIGFRYKLALVGIPLVFSFLYADSARKTKYLTAFASAAGFLVLFSIMTLYRSKFGIPDFTKPLSNPVERLALGVFAETNIVYGLATVISHNVREGQLHLFTPLLDSAKELLPRFLFPGRETGQYLREMMLGFGTKEGIQSLTAYPWIGEFMMMFGWSGIVIGPACLGALYCILKAALARTVNSNREWTMGLFLIAGIIGYYQFGRGYAPQMTKAYLFVAAPYLLLCFLGSRSQVPRASHWASLSLPRQMRGRPVNRFSPSSKS